MLDLEKKEGGSEVKVLRYVGFSSQVKEHVVKKWKFIMKRKC